MSGLLDSIATSEKKAEKNEDKKFHQIPSQILMDSR
jgi:hypothetical protein